MSFHGVQMDKPRENDLPTLNTTFQMMYHRYVSRKNKIKSMTYMIVSVNGTWFVQRELPKNLSLHPCTFVRAITAMGPLNDEVKKKYDSANLQPKISPQSIMEAIRGLRASPG